MTNWTPEEQAEHRKLWVEALRSGKYQQATHKLRKGDGMCCLGVACDISGLGHWFSDETYSIPGHLLADQVLPSPVRDWLGLYDNGSQFYTASGAHCQLSELNDNGTSFEEIEDVIESEPKGLLATSSLGVK